MILPDTMLLVLPVPFGDVQNGICVEKQAANGISQWAEHFGRLTVCAPSIPLLDEAARKKYVHLRYAQIPRNVDCVALPYGYHPVGHFSKVRQVKCILAELIAKSRFLQFAIGGCTFGDWAASAARLAVRKRRAFAVHTDWVTHQVVKHDCHENLRKRVWNSSHYRLMRVCERWVISRANLGLFHGADCFEFYRRWQPNAELVHNIHVKSTCIPQESAVRDKADGLRENGKLKIIYVGRMHPMKGPYEWIKCLSILQRQGIQFEATWVGDGRERDKMLTMITELGLKSVVHLRPFEENQSLLLKQIQQADLFLFCHLTPESPRNLLEALGQATPIVGYETQYSRDLIQDGGGVLVTSGDVARLASTVAGLTLNRKRLSQLTLEAGRVGSKFTDRAVFSHRAELMKQLPVRIG